MITARELNPKGHPLPASCEGNFDRLVYVINRVREAYDKPMIVERGYSTPEEQASINPHCPHDAHVMAAACDIYDGDGALWVWSMDNLEFLEDLGLFLESKSYTPKHVHFQIYSPKSGHRIFIP